MDLQIQENISLANHSTMRLGGTARYMTEINSKWDVVKAWKWAKERNLPMIMIGGGSNIIWKDEGFRGLLVVNRIKGYEDYAEDARSHYITVGAGEIWDRVVLRTVESGLTGIEALSLIPGRAGATPVQNVGAYGQEVSQTITSVEVFDTETETLKNIPTEECKFGYRSSLFQTDYRGKYFITGLTFHLRAGNPEPPFYGALSQYFDSHNSGQLITPAVMRDAVISIRQNKLPDPSEVANCGSFFANPVINSGQLIQLRADYPEMPAWPTDDGGAKIPAAWLIEQVGFKGVNDEETGMGTWPKQPLVMVNNSAESTTQLLIFRGKIISAIEEKFGITLRQEPEILPLSN